MKISFSEVYVLERAVEARLQYLVDEGVFFDEENAARSLLKKIKELQVKFELQEGGEK